MCTYLPSVLGPGPDPDPTGPDLGLILGLDLISDPEGPWDLGVTSDLGSRSGSDPGPPPDLGVQPEIHLDPLTPAHRGHASVRIRRRRASPYVHVHLLSVHTISLSLYLWSSSPAT